jgi:general L-amino acid transport system substrate-binding protein
MQKKDLQHFNRGEIDLLARNTTWTASRDVSLGLNFTGVNYYDSQVF